MIKSRIGQVLIMGVLVLTVFSCNLQELDNPILIPLVDQEFELEMWQSLSPQGSEVEVEIKTLLLEECENSTILTGLTASSNSSEVIIFQILPPEDCIVGTAPAHGSESLGRLGVGTHHLTINLNDLVQNTGRITTSVDAYTVEMDTEDGIGWSYYELRRIPATALWGYLSYTTDQQASDALVFLNNLNDIGVPSTLEEGQYGHFKLSDLGDVSVKDAPLDQTIIPFLLGFEGDQNTLNQMVASFRASAQDGLELVMFDGVGVVY